MKNNCYAPLVAVLALSAVSLPAEPLVLNLKSVPLSEEDIQSLSAEVFQPRALRLKDGQATLPMAGEPVVDIAVEDGSFVYTIKGEAVRDSSATAKAAFVPVNLGNDASIRIKATGGAEPVFARYFNAKKTEGTWPDSEGEPMRIALIDTDQDGAFDNPDGTTLLLDLDGDGQFDTGQRAIEYRKLGNPFTLGGTTWQPEANHSGTQLTLKPIDDPDAERLQPLAIGKPAPDWEAEDFDGNEVSLTDFRGKFVYLDIWATWCGPCIQEMPTIQKTSEDYADENVVFISVSIDESKSSAVNFIKEKGYTYTQLWTKGAWQSDICRAYEVSGIPSTFLIDPEGTLIAKSIRGEELPKSIAMVTRYDQPEGKAYFEELQAVTILMEEVGDLAQTGKEADAVEKLKKYLEEHPDSPSKEKLQRVLEFYESRV